MTSADLNWVAPHIKLNPPESFYRNSPTDPPATFSTRCGKIPVRQLPDPAPPVVIRSNVDGDIRSMATSLRQDFPAIVREIKKPTSWYNLYNYFDAVDLWYQGASFLFYVLNHISNENIVLNHELEESKHQEISNWAKLWVEANVKRILSIPPGQDLISTFDESEMESIRGLEPRQKTILRQELNNHRKGYEQLLVPVEDPRVQSHQQSFQQMHQQDPSQHPIHHQVPQRQPMMQPSMQPSMPAMHPGPSMTGKPYPMAVDEPRRNQIVPMQPMQPMQAIQAMQPMQPMQPMNPQPSPNHIPFNMLMENRGQVSLVPQPPTGPGDFHQDGVSYWGRQRGYSNEITRNGRGRGNAHFNNFGHKNRSNFPANDRRMAANNTTPRGSPPRRLSQVNQPIQGAIYVHNSRRQSPPFDDDATPRASGRSTIQNNPRVVSDPSSDHTTFSNDARLWSSNRERTYSIPQDQSDAPQPRTPFEGHPQAFFMDNGNSRPSCTFWYHGEARKPGDYHAPRTLYVQNFHRDEFESHRLKDRFVKFGKIEYISYLFDKYRGGGGPAFVAYVDEGCREAAIAGLNGYKMPDGQVLFVSVPRARDRAGSQSSEYGYPYHHSNVGRDNYYRANSRRGSVRNPSISYRESDFLAGDRGSSGVSSPSDAPLTAGFQAQLQAAQPLTVQDVAGPLTASLAEVVQHQMAISRFSNQNQIPLGSIENYSNTHNKDSNRTHDRKTSNTGIDQPRMAMSQGSHNRKENSPTKKTPSKNTPLTSPMKDFSRSQGGDNNQKGGSGKKNSNNNNKKGNRQNSSNKPSRAPSPVKSDIEDALLAALEAEQSQQEKGSPAKKVHEETPITDKEQQTSPQADTAKSFAATDENSSSIAEPKKLGSESSATKTTNDEEKVTCLLNGVEGLGLDIPATTSKDATQAPEVPMLEVKPTVGQPGTAFPKPKIEVTAEQDDSAVEEDFPALDDSKSEAIDILVGLDVESKPKKKYNNSGSRKNKKRKSAAKSDAGQSSSSIASKDSSETIKSFFMAEGTEHFVTAQSSPNPSLTSGFSDTCVCSDDPTKSIAAGGTTIPSVFENNQQPFSKHSKSDSNVTFRSIPQPNIQLSNKQHQVHSKNNSSSSASSIGSVRMTNRNSPQNYKANENLKPEGKASNDLHKEKSQPSSPAVDFEDSMQWPALAPPKTPINDSKAPTVPAIQPLSEHKKNLNSPIVPVVPLNMQRRRPS